MSIIYNLGKQNPKSKSASLKYRLYLADIDDVDVENFPAVKNGKITKNVLKEGATWSYIDANTTSINPNAAAGEAPMNGKLSLSPTIEGLTEEGLQWFYDNVGRNVVVVWEVCATGKKMIGGSPCSNGLQIKYGGSGIGKQDGGINGISTVFEGEECSEPFAFYEPEEFPITPNADEPAGEPEA
jgi:hypothetical protein